MAAMDDLPLPHLPANVPAGIRSMIAIVSAQPGKEDEFRSRIVELAREVRKEPGCLSFVPYESLEVEGEFYLVEVYASSEAFEEHLQTDHVARYMASRPSLSGQELSKLVQLVEVPVPEGK
jgi:quinol monooxygenase YgiN